ncbi:MAG: response regulator [Actinobacteria bacterium]|nr:response regulator [Actinomycetota bacterium]
MAKILVVDDSPTILDVVTSVLIQEGYEVITAADGLEGLNKARSEKPDLIILDVMLPKMQGYQVCRLLKFDENYKEIPILMYTSRDQEDHKITGLKTGADDYLIKPIEQERLVALVREHLEKKKEKTI